MSGRRSWMVMVAVATLAAAAPGEESAEEILEKVRKKYDTLQDAELRFTQKSRFAVSRVEETVQGTLLLKKGNRYRVEMGDHAIVTDGTTVWAYSASTNQVLIDDFFLDERALTPERVLTAAPDEYAPALLGKEKVGRAEAYVLKLVPRDEDAFIRSLKLWITEGDYLMRRVDLVDVTGKETTYLVQEIRINIGVVDDRFQFIPPEGTEIIDLR